METKYNTFNRQFVGSNGESITLMAPKTRMTKAEALVHAAWIVALADDNNEFDAVLRAVQST